MILDMFRLLSVRRLLPEPALTSLQKRRRLLDAIEHVYPLLTTVRAPTVGVEVGAGVGSDVVGDEVVGSGCAVGRAVGYGVGRAVGCAVVGRAVVGSDVVGVREGNVDGSTVGKVVGDAVGVCAPPESSRLLHWKARNSQRSSGQSDSTQIALHGTGSPISLQT